MKWPIFGKRQPDPAESAPKAAPAAGTQRIDAYPWQPQSLITGNFAIGLLRDNVLQWMTTEKGIHVETLAMAIGSLAGFAAQCAALSRAQAMTERDGHVPDGALVLVDTNAGERFLYGDLINQPLILQPGGDHFTLWNMLAGAALGLGVAQADLPDFGALAGRAAASLNTPDFERLSSGGENHQPHMTPSQLLAKAWAATEGLLRNPLPNGAPPEPPLLETHWPIVCSVVAGQYLHQTKDALDPRLTMALMVEAAIIASKLHPDRVTPGRWRIEPSNGRLAVHRL